MNARQLAKRSTQVQRVYHYTVGRIYQLDDIRPLSPKLKTISSRQINGHFFHLFREMGTHNMWMEGPFKGPGSSGFMYLGPKQTKSQLKKFLLTEFKTLLHEFVDHTTEMLAQLKAPDFGLGHSHVHLDALRAGFVDISFENIDASDWSE